MKYRKKPVVIDATKWIKNGDHPLDDIHDIPDEVNETTFESEGKIVRYYRTPDLDGDRRCKCGAIMHVHGWIDTLEGGHIVCPGDWIITGVEGEHYPCKPKIFDATYDDVRGLGF